MIRKMHTGNVNDISPIIISTVTLECLHNLFTYTCVYIYIYKNIVMYNNNNNMYGLSHASPSENKNE